MKDPSSGPFLFDTSAEVRLTLTRDPDEARWFKDYLELYPVYVSAMTVVERIRGYALLWQQTGPDRRMHVELTRIEYLTQLGTVLPFDLQTAIVAAEIMALIPNPPAPRRRSHRSVESRQERLARWRFDVMIAATALVHRMTLIHNNAEDFETIRGAIERTPQRFPRLGPLELVRCNAVA